MAIDLETMQRVLLDLNQGIAPEDSELSYTEEMVQFRERTAREFAEFASKHPGASIDVPHLDGSATEDAALAAAKAAIAARRKR